MPENNLFTLKFNRVHDSKRVAELIGTQIDYGTRCLTAGGKTVGSYVPGTRYDSFRIAPSEETAPIIRMAQELGINVHVNT